MVLGAVSPAVGGFRTGGLGSVFAVVVVVVRVFRRSS